MASKNIELIRQALGAAESSIKLAKQLLSELENSSGNSKDKGKIEAKNQYSDVPGIVGIFDGENMVSETGETFPVPSNYASKSMLVVGDTLKLVEEGKNKEKRFKQIEHVKRHKSNGILTKKDGKWRAVTAEGSYKVLAASVEHFGGDIGSEVIIHLPANNLTVAYGAIESVKGKETKDDQKQFKEVDSGKVEAKLPETPKPQETHEEKPKPVVEEKKVEPKKEMVEVKQISEKPKVKKPEPKKEMVAPQAPLEEKKVVEGAKKVETREQPVNPQPQTVNVPQPLEVAPEEEELT